MPNPRRPKRPIHAPPDYCPRNTAPAPQIVSRDTVCASCAASGVPLRDHPLPRQFRQTLSHTPRFTFFRRCIPASRRFSPPVCVHDGAGSRRPSILSITQYSSGSQVARHCSKRFPVRLPPSWTTNLRLLQFGHRFGVAEPQVGALYARFAATMLPINGHPRVCAHCATFCLLPRFYARRQRRRVFAQNQSRCLSLSSRRAAQPWFFILPPVVETLPPDQTGIIHIAIQRFGKATVTVQRACMKGGERIVDGRHQRRNILRTRQTQSLGRGAGKHPRLTDQPRWRRSQSGPAGDRR